MKKLLVTGAVGFIGSAFCRFAMRVHQAEIIAIDCMTYAASPQTLKDLATYGRFSFHKIDICDAAALEQIFQTTQPDAVVHLAAETHVDRSIDNPEVFIRTNVMGTFALLEAAHEYWSKKNLEQSRFRFLHVSTDEVYGSLGTEGKFDHKTAYAPNSPYSASKAAADHLVRAWFHTYGMPTLISNCSNNYGPFQFPEKLIPHIIIKALAQSALPIYGTGMNVRDWLYVDDHAEALWTIMTRGKPGEKYLVGGDGEKNNLEIVIEICRLLDIYVPMTTKYESLIQFVKDRPGHDLRYAIDYSKLRDELGWKPKMTLKDGLKSTVQWYLNNKPWWQEILDGEYTGKRLGQGSSLSVNGLPR